MSTQDKPKEPRLNIKVDEDTLWQLKKKAAEERKTVTDLVNAWLQEKLAEKPQERLACAG